MEKVFNCCYWYSKKDRCWHIDLLEKLEERLREGLNVVRGNTVIGPPEGPPGMYDRPTFRWWHV
jgi:hypothetical protein